MKFVTNRFEFISKVTINFILIVVLCILFYVVYKGTQLCTLKMVFTASILISFISFNFKELLLISLIMIILLLITMLTPINFLILVSIFFANWFLKERINKVSFSNDTSCGLGFVISSSAKEFGRMLIGFIPVSKTVSANIISAIGVLCAIASVILLIRGFPYYAVVLMSINLVLDLYDGKVSRGVQKNLYLSGIDFDSVCDRMSEFIVTFTLFMYLDDYRIKIMLIIGLLWNYLFMLKIQRYNTVLIRHYMILVLLFKEMLYFPIAFLFILLPTFSRIFLILIGKKNIEKLKERNKKTFDTSVYECKRCKTLIHYTIKMKHDDGNFYHPRCLFMVSPKGVRLWGLIGMMIGFVVGIAVIGIFTVVSVPYGWKKGMDFGYWLNKKHDAGKNTNIAEQFYNNSEKRLKKKR